MAEATSPRGGLFDRKSVESAVSEAEQSGFQRVLGPFDLTSIGIAAIIGAGIFFYLGAQARDTGPAVLVSLVVAGFAAILAAFTYAEFASLIPGSGSAYTYAYAALGRFPAFLMGWLVLNAYAVGNMAVVLPWSGFFVTGLARLGVTVPGEWTLPPSQGGIIDLPAAGLMLLITVLCLPRIRESTRLNNTLVVLKLAIVGLIIVVGAFYVRPSNWQPFSPAGFEGVAVSTAALFFAYFGFDTVAATAEEARNPRRDLPIGILVSVGVSMVLYLLMAGVVTGMTPATLMPDPDFDPPVPAGFRRVGADWAADLITLGALIGLATVAFAFHVAVSRVLFAMARDGFLPRRLARLHPRQGTPWNVTILVGVATALGAGLLPVASVLDMAVLATIAMYVLVAAGVLAVRWLRPGLPGRYRAPAWVHGLAILVLLAMAVLGIQSPLIHLAFWAWIGAGLVLYGFYAHPRSFARSL